MDQHHPDPADTTPTFKHAMVDLETLGKIPGAIPASIGAVMFDPLTGDIGPTFYVVIDRASCEAVGLKADPETVAWWADQSPEAQAALTQDPQPLPTALDAFSAWWAANTARRFWCQGPSFDQTILAAAYRACWMTEPWEYHSGRDTRTIYELGGIKADSAGGTLHNALDDARSQAVAVARNYAALGLNTAARAGPKAPEASGTGREACVNHTDRPSRTNLDGDNLCQECADDWVRGEGNWAAEMEAREAGEG